MQPSPRELLKWYVDIGLDEAMEETPQNRFSAVEPIEKPAPVTIFPEEKKALEDTKEALGTIEALKEAETRAAEAKTLEELRPALENFSGLTLKRTATQIVFADGNPAAKIMLIGDPPGTDEDRAGVPFSGAAGEMLDKMFGAIGLTREKDLYITGVLHWRPPGNRAPTEAELALSLPFVERQIALVRPQVLVFVGGLAMKTLMQTAQSITRLRGQWLSYERPFLPEPVAAMALFHPAYLMASPAQKKLAWEDLQMLKARLQQ